MKFVKWIPLEGGGHKLVADLSEIPVELPLNVLVERLENRIAHLEGAMAREIVER